MRLQKHLDERQRAELASLMGSIRMGLARVADIVDAAAAKSNDEETRQGAELFRQVTTAIDLQCLFPTVNGERAVELTRGLLEGVFNGPVPTLGRVPTPEPQEAPQSDPEQWSDTLG
jgi:hypothetical protein